MVFKCQCLVVGTIMWISNNDDKIMLDHNNKIIREGGQELIEPCEKTIVSQKL